MMETAFSARKKFVFALAFSITVAVHGSLEARATSCESSFLTRQSSARTGTTADSQAKKTNIRPENSRGFFARAGLSIQDAARRFQNSTLLRRSAEEYIQTAEARPTQYRPASRTNLLADQEAEKTWKGLSGQLLNLPNWLRLVERYLPTSKSRGFIGEIEPTFTTLRVEWGDKLKTNIGVGSALLKSLFFRPQAEVAQNGIRPEWAKAIVIYLHGGGTASTGHHVGKEYQQNLEAMNIFVTSMDYVLHGHGWQKSPTHFKAAAEEVRRLGRLIQGNSKIPMGIEGHSMGAVFVSMYRQYYPNDDVFNFLIANSEIIDPAPGEDFHAKLAKYDELDAWTSLQTELTEYMRNLPRSLMANGKLSLFLGMVCDAWISILDQTPPADNGASSLPILRNMGTYDPLFFHPEYQEGFKRLGSQLNTYTSVMDLRRIKEDPTGPLQKIDHMITDHRVRIDFADEVPTETQTGILSLDPKYRKEFERLRAEGKVTVVQPDWTKSVRVWSWDDLTIPETHLITANFIEKTTGVELGVRKQKPQKQAEIDAAPASTTWISTDATDHMLWAYTAIPAFREFAETYTYIYTRLNADKHKTVKPQQDELRKAHKRLDEAIRAAHAAIPGWEAKLERATDLVRSLASGTAVSGEDFDSAFPHIAPELRKRLRLPSAAPASVTPTLGQTHDAISDMHQELTSLMRDKGRPLPQHRAQWQRLKAQLEQVEAQASSIAAPSDTPPNPSGDGSGRTTRGHAQDLDTPIEYLKLEELAARQERIITAIKPRQKKFDRLALWIDAPQTIGQTEKEVSELIEKAFSDYGHIRTQFSNWLYQNLNPDGRSYKSGLFERMPNALWSQVQAFDQTVATLKAKNKLLAEHRHATALSGQFDIKDSLETKVITNVKEEQAAKSEARPTVQEIATLAREITGFYQDLEILHGEIRKRSAEYSRLQNEAHRIELAMRALQDTEYFEFRVMTPKQLLDHARAIRDLPTGTQEERAQRDEAIKDFESLASRIMGEWNRIWSLRLRDVAAPDSLY